MLMLLLLCVIVSLTEIVGFIMGSPMVCCFRVTSPKIDRAGVLLIVTPDDTVGIAIRVINIRESF